MTAYFDFRGVVHYEFLPPRQTVNKEYFVEEIRLKISEVLLSNFWFFHRDNAPSHTTLHSFPFSLKFDATSGFS